MEFVIPDLWVAAVAAIIPLLTAAIARAEAGDNLRRAIAVVLAAVLAVVTTVVDSGGVSSTSVLASTFVTAMLVQLTSYVAVWQGLDVNRRLAPKVGVMR